MANRSSTFLLKRSNVLGKIPVLSGLTLGELALNLADAKLYTLYTGGFSGATEVREIGWDKLSISGGTILGSLSATTYYGDGSNLTDVALKEQITVGENVLYGDLLYLSADSRYYKASYTSESTSSTELRISLENINSGNTGYGLSQGKFTTTGLTSGEIYIVGSNGSITNTEPIADGSIIRIVGTALDTNTLEFNPDQTYIEISSGISVEPPNCIPDLYVSNLHSCSPLHINPNGEGDILIGENGGVNIGIGTSSPTSLLDVNGELKASSIQATTINADNLTINSSISGIEISSVNGLQIALDDKADETTLSLHITNTNNPHQTSFSKLTSTAHTHTISDISDLNVQLTAKTDLSLFISHTGNTNNPHQTSFSNLISTAHTHTISDISNLQNILNNKLNASGGTISNNLIVQGNFTVLGSATTINTEVLAVKDNTLSLNSNLTGGTEPFFGDSGIEVLRGSATTATLVWNESNDYWVAGFSGNTKKIVLQGDSLSLLTSAHTHTISEVTDLQTSLNNKFNSSGGTINGNISATTISATTFYGNGQFLTGLITTDYYVTGGTFSGTTLILRRNGLNDVTITGFSSSGSLSDNYLPLSGGTITGNLGINGNISSINLSGTTDRIMEVDTTGLVSANRRIITAYLTSGSTTDLLDNTSNWSPSGVYTGSTISGTFQGQKHYNSSYFFEAVDDNLWIRLIRG